jgi:hypothetical protein
MTEQPTSEIPRLNSTEYLAGRRDALKTLYLVVTARPTLLREEIIEILRVAVLDSERKLKEKSTNTKSPTEDR